MAAMLHARNNTILFLWDKMFILMQNIFIVPGIQHGPHAKPLLYSNDSLVKWRRGITFAFQIFGRDVVYPKF